MTTPSWRRMVELLGVWKVFEEESVSEETGKGEGMTREMRFNLCLHMIDQLSEFDLERFIKWCKESKP